MLKALFCDQCGTRLTDGQCDKCANPSKHVVIQKLTDIETHEKIELFDELYRMCAQHVESVGRDDRCACDCDCRTYAWEATMKACMGPRIFDFTNHPSKYLWPHNL